MTYKNNKNVLTLNAIPKPLGPKRKLNFSLRLEVCVLLVWQTLSMGECSELCGCYPEGSLAELSLDRSKNRSMFDADLRTVGEREQWLY